MRLQRYFALSLCLLVAASLGCSSNSGSAQQPQQPAAPNTPNGNTATTTTAGATSPATAGATSPATTTAASPATAKNVCGLLTSDEIKSVQGEAVLEAKPNHRPDSPFAVNQCFYMTPSFTKSVSIEVTERGASTKSVHEFWEEQVEKSGEESERERDRERGRKGETAKEREREREEEREREAKKPRRLKGIGDEAYWINTNANSTMYAFKKDKLLRISIGGTDADDVRMKKIKTLAQKALARL
jgi:hypothetical protein